MRLCDIPRKYTDWIKTKLENRTTNICFDDYRSHPMNILAGLDQGCALSPTLYNIYNSPLVEIPDPARKRQEMASGFFDDVVLASRDKSIQEANNHLVCMMEKEGGGLAL